VPHLYIPPLAERRKPPLNVEGRGVNQMKRLSFLLIIFSLTIIFSACPPLEEDDMDSVSSEYILSIDDPALNDPDQDIPDLKLDVFKWFKILDKIARDGKYVTLDLSKGTYKKDNKSGGLFKYDDEDADEPIKFDPFPASSSGKNYIVSIILPTVTQEIMWAEEDDSAIKNDEESVKNTKKLAAFRSFSNLRSVKAENVTRIGNFAFADCKALDEVIFPKVGHTVTNEELMDFTNSPDNGYRRDIGKYAFQGCTSLKEVKFNSAAVIGGYAFKDCTNLSKIDFPKVWRIEDNAFEGCKSLVNVFFEEASKIGKEAFKDCTGLKKAEFNIEQKRLSTGDIFTDDPDDPCVYDSVIFYPSVFTGDKALEVLNIRRAWNVYFSKNVLAKTSAVIEIYLFDESETGTVGCVGHPQKEMFLGDSALAVTLKKVNIFIPIQVKDGKVIDNLAKDIRQNDKDNIYKDIDVNVNQRVP